MQIVIDISEEEYDAIKAGHSVWLTAQRGGGKTITIDLIKAVHNGTPIPKGHGRLIDADAIWDLYHDYEYDFYEAFNDVPTIIETDNAVDE